jgi:hypothetical protein
MLYFIYTNKGADQVYYSVKVTTDTGYPIAGYLNFQTYGTAVNFSLTCRGQTTHSPAEYFEAGTLTEKPTGEVINDIAVQTDHLFSYWNRLVKN